MLHIGDDSITDVKNMSVLSALPELKNNRSALYREYKYTKSIHIPQSHINSSNPKCGDNGSTFAPNIPPENNSAI